MLDLCAAPGGKSTQIAARIGQSGFLIANEIDGGRARVLMSNLERLGVSEAMITHASPERLCPQLGGWMDKVLVDAPCSGEGMFKKEDRALADWSVEHVRACGQRQQKILESAVFTPVSYTHLQPKRIACAILDEGLARSIQDAVMK